MKKTGERAKGKKRAGTPKETPAHPLVHILVVEDEDAHVALICRGFEAVPGKFRVSVAPTLADARRIIADDPPALAFVDWLLPDGKGAELLTAGETTPVVPIIIMTSYGNEALAVELMKKGALDYLVKSDAVFAGIAQTAERALREWNQIAERKKAEEASQHSESRFRELFNSISSGVAVYEAVDDGADFVFVDFNRAAETIEKIKKDDVIGRRVSGVFPGVREFGLLAVFSRVWRTGQPEQHPISLYKDERIEGWRDNFVYRLPSGEIVAVYNDVTKQKQAEETLRESEEKYRELADSITDIFFAMDPDLRYTYWNKASEDLTGIPAQDAIGKSIYEIFADTPETRRAAEVYQDVVTTQKPRSFVNEYHLQGEHLFFEINAYPSVGGIAVFTKDITARKRAEDALRESEERFRTIIRSMQFGIVIIDAQTHTILEANQKALDMIGGTSDIVSGSVCHRFICPAESGRCPVTDLKQTVDSSERVLLTLQGEKIPILKSVITTTLGGKEVLIESFVDITERKRAEAALQKSELDLREAQRVGHLGSWDLNVVTGDLQWSDECFRIYGFKPQEFVPRYEKFRSIVHPEDLGFVQEEVDAALNNDKHYDVDFRFVRPNGETGCIHCEGEVTRDAEGKPLRFFGTQIDITERKKTEEELQALTRELEDRVKERTAELEAEIARRILVEGKISQSLHEKDVLLREIHHRVKNNLQIIISLLRLQKRQISDPSTLQHILDSESRIRSMALVHEKLYRSDNLASINFGDYIKTLSMDLINLYALDRSRIKFTVDLKDIAIDINRAIPVGLLMNELISNALKHAFPDGRRGEITIRGEKRDSDAVITVMDNGIGIPADFDWRSTTTLGLHLVVTLVDQVKGSIELVQEGGSMFVIRIPVAQDVK